MEPSAWSAVKESVNPCWDVLAAAAAATAAAAAAVAAAEVSLGRRTAYSVHIQQYNHPPKL